MAILSKDEFFSRIHNRMGDDVSDESISFLEDMTDTYNSLEQRANGDGTDWERKYHELDESWKKRYRHRFFTGESNIPSSSNEKDDDEYNPESITIDSLFKTK